MKFHYRMSTKEDLDALIQLWCDHGGWDRVDAKAWAHRFLNPPLGEAQIALTTNADTGKIVGQFLFIPSLVSVNGKEVNALRPFAPILAGEARSPLAGANPLRHPIVGMYRCATKSFPESGYRLLYMLPDPRWTRFFRMFPWLQLGSFPLWSRLLPLNAPLQLGSGYETSELSVWDERVDRLWKDASRSHACSVVRDSRVLPWKIGSGDYTVLQVNHHGNLIGLVASRHKGEFQWLVCDMLAADSDESLVNTLKAAVNLAHMRALSADPALPIRKVALLITPPMEKVARGLGFNRDDYDFTLVVDTIDPSLKKSEVAPAHWYLSAND